MATAMSRPATGFWDRGRPGANGQDYDTLKELVDLKTFLDRLRPPEFLIDPILQRGFLYTLTAPTYHGKTSLLIYMALCVAAGKAFADRYDTEQGIVVYFAGENADDTGRKFETALDYWGLTSEEVASRVFIYDGHFNMSASIDEAARLATAKQPVLIIIDTSAAYRYDETEIDDQLSKKWGQTLREFTHLPSHPVVITACHPVKNPDRKTQLVPRGGGAFLAEIDVNLSMWSDLEDGLSELHWQGKMRGPAFPPINLELTKHDHPTWCHKNGKPVKMAVITPTDRVMSDKGDRKETKEQFVLRCLDNLLSSDEAEELPHTDGYPSAFGLRCINEKRWGEECAARGGLSDSDDPRMERQQFLRYKQAILRKQKACERNKLVWKPRPEARP